MLRATDLTVEIGPRLLVADASFTVAPGDVVGLVGPNGAGKTTLLGTLAEAARATGALMGSAGPAEDPEATQVPGNPGVQLTGTLAWLPQEPPPTRESTGLARLLSARGLDRARQELEAARLRIDATADARARDRAIKCFSNLQEREVRAASEARRRKVLDRDIKRLSAFVEKYRHANEVMARRAIVTERRVERMKASLVPERRG